MQALRAGWSMRGRRRQLLALDHAHYAVHAGADAAVEVALAEARHDVVVDDALRDGVGQHALQAIADLEFQPPIILGDHQQHAVVHPFAAELPRLLDAHRVLLDGLGLRAGHDEHGELRAFARLELGEGLLERGVLRGVQRAGEVRDAALQRRHVERPR